MGIMKQQASKGCRNPHPTAVLHVRRHSGTWLPKYVSMSLYRLAAVCVTVLILSSNDSDTFAILWCKGREVVVRYAHVSVCCLK